MIIALAMAFAASSPLPSSSTNALPVCSAAQIAITFDGENGTFAGMSHAGTLLVVRNIGTSACRMPALLELRFEDAAHHPLAIVRQIPKGMHPGPAVPPVSIAPGAEATAELRWVSGDVHDGHQCVTTAVATVQIGAETYRQAFSGRFCSDVNTPATSTQAWLKTEAVL